MLLYVARANRAHKCTTIYYDPLYCQVQPSMHFSPNNGTLLSLSQSSPVITAAGKDKVTI